MSLFIEEHQAQMMLEFLLPAAGDIVNVPSWLEGSSSRWKVIRCGLRSDAALCSQVCYPCSPIS